MYRKITKNIIKELTFIPGGEMEVFSPIEWGAKIGKVWKIE
ncbi:hypothetical protein [Cetobacterium somerae]